MFEELTSTQDDDIFPGITIKPDLALLSLVTEHEKATHSFACVISISDSKDKRIELSGLSNP